MQITLTEEILRGAKEEAMAMLGAATIKRDAAYAEHEKALQLFDYVQSLKVGESVISFVLPRLVPDPEGEVVPSTDNRPEGWRQQFGYVFPSRSGGKGHEVTYNNGVSSCNCEAEEKGGYSNKCYARKAVEAAGGFLMTDGYSTTVHVGYLTGNRIFFTDESDNPDFGLIRRDS